MTLKRIYHYEFWPFWLFYIPAFFYYFFLAIRAKRWVYFSTLNNSMNFGGAFLSSKNNYLKEIPIKWVPTTIFVPPQENFNKTQKKLREKKITFPLIVKPDMGERGKNVALLSTPKELEDYLKKANQPSLIQEYISYPIELGILFYWNTKKRPVISSIGVKTFCEIEGNGNDTLKQLVSKNHRISKRKEFLSRKFKKDWHRKISSGEKILIEPIGNHNLGTTFCDGRKNYSKEMLLWVANCVKNIPGFDYRRLDIKIKDWSAFKNNDGIKIIEINGINSEPIHIYDPNYNLWKAYRDIFQHMNIIYKLSKNKRELKIKPISLIEFIMGAKKALNQKKITQHLYL